MVQIIIPKTREAGIAQEVPRFAQRGGKAG